MKELNLKYKDKNHKIMIRKKGKLYPIELKIKLKLEDKKNELFGKIKIKDVILENNSYYHCEKLSMNDTYVIEIEKNEKIDENRLQQYC